MAAKGSLASSRSTGLVWSVLLRMQEPRGSKRIALGPGPLLSQGNDQVHLESDKRYYRSGSIPSGVDRSLFEPPGILLDEREAVCGVGAHQPVDQILDRGALLIFLRQR